MVARAQFFVTPVHALEPRTSVDQAAHKALVMEYIKYGQPDVRRIQVSAHEAPPLVVPALRAAPRRTRSSRPHAALPLLPSNKANV